MSESCSEATFFASPERLSAEGIAREIAALGDVASALPLLDAMPGFVMLMNRQRQILLANEAVRAYARARGQTVIVGLRLGELFDCRQAAMAPSGCGTGETCRTCGAVQAILGGLAGDSTQLECRVVTDAQDPLDLKVFASPFAWRGDEYALVVATDISGQKQRQALERIFFHDVMNAASGLHSLVDVLERDREAAKALSPLLRHSSQALIDEIRGHWLLVASENEEQAVVARTELLAHAQLEALADLYRPQLAASRRTITVEAGPRDLAFVSAPAVLGRVLGNLVKNAVEATRPGDAIRLGVSVRAGAAPGERELVFWVHNPGAIPSALQPLVFGRNFSTKGPGRGIGTFGARLLTERYLGGRVTFTSTPEAGTCFEVALPLAPG